MKTFAALLTALGLLTAPSAHADTVVVTADRMLDVIAGRVVERPQITITDGRISAVAAQGSPMAPGARRIDLPGMTQIAVGPPWQMFSEMDRMAELVARGTIRMVGVSNFGVKAMIRAAESSTCFKSSMKGQVKK